MSFAADDKGYAMGIQGNNDNFEIAYKAGTDPTLSDTNLLSLTSGGNLTIAGAGNIVLGVNDNATSTIQRKQNTANSTGGKLIIEGGNASGHNNQKGGNLEFVAGKGTGSATSGDIIFKVEFGKND